MGTHNIRKALYHRNYQRSIAFMLDNRKRSKIKNDKIQSWRLMELSSFSYSIRYRPGKENVVADALSRSFCNATNATSQQPLSPWSHTNASLCPNEKSPILNTRSEGYVLILSHLCRIKTTLRFFSPSNTNQVYQTNGTS